MLALALARGPAARLLALRPLHYLGEISYSVYLVHYCVLGGLNLLAIRPAGLYAAAALVLTLATSAATYRWIERPARRFVTRRVEKRSAFRRPLSLRPRYHGKFR
jgi:peptidoglycan/LPS O-acetylase OafA/YrhL